VTGALALSASGSMILQDLTRHATHADLSSIKETTSGLQSAILLMPPALLFMKLSTRTRHSACAAVQSRSHLRSRAENKSAIIPVAPGQACYRRFKHGRSQADQLYDCCPSPALKACRLDVTLSSCMTVKTICHSTMYEPRTGLTTHTAWDHGTAHAQPCSIC
jgi:hypothetical protein